MDAKSTFLNGILEEEIYVQQPLGYEVEGQKYKVNGFMKALSGIKQAPRAWYNKIANYMIKNGFCRSNIERTQRQMDVDTF